MTQSKPQSAALILCEVPRDPYPGLDSFSPFVIKVRRALRLAKLPYLHRARPTPTEHRDVNPAGQVPALITPEGDLRDSTDILRYIEGQVPGAFEAKDAEALLWEDFADTSINAYMVMCRWASEDSFARLREMFFGPAPEQVWGPIRKNVLAALEQRQVIKKGLEDGETRFRELLDHLAARAPEPGKHWCTEGISVADIAIFAQLQSLRCPVTQRWAQEIDERPRLVAYLDAIDAETKSAPDLGTPEF